MAFSMSYGATPKPTAKAKASTATAPAKPARRPSRGNTALAKAEALFDPSGKTDPAVVGTSDDEAAG